MSDEAAEVRLLREALEGALAPEVAHAVLFDALGAELPSSADGWAALVHGPLSQALTARVGEAVAQGVLAHVGQMMALISPGAATAGARGERVSRQPTATMPTDDQPVPVLVLAATGAFGERLRAALGPERAVPLHAPDEARVRAAAHPFPPAIVVIDATNVPALEPGDLEALMAPYPATTTWVVWAAELPYGRRVVEALEHTSHRIMTLPQAGGVDPLLDVVRSRQRQ